MNPKVPIVQIDTIVEKLFYELLGKTHITEDEQKIAESLMRNLSEKYLSKFYQATSDSAFAVLLRFLLEKHVALMLLSRILVTNELWPQKFPSSLIKTLAAFTGLDIALILNANALLVKLSRQLLEFKDTAKTIKAFLNWNLGLDILTPAYVNVRLRKDNPDDLTQAFLEFEDFRDHTRVLLPVNVEMIYKSTEQVGILSETHLAPNKKFNQELLKPLKHLRFRTNLIAFYIKPFGQDMRTLAETQRRLIMSLFLYAYRLKGKTFHSKIFDKDFTALQAVSFYVALIELAKYLRQKELSEEYGFITDKTLVLANASVNVIRWDTPLRRTLTELIKFALIRQGWNPFLAQKLAEVISNYKEDLQQIDNPDLLALTIIEHNNFTLEEQRQILSSKDKLFHFVQLLEIYVNSLGVTSSFAYQSDFTRALQNSPGIQTDKIIAVELLSDTELENLLVAFKRLYKDRLIDAFSIALTAEYFLAEISKNFNLPVVAGLTIADFISFDPESVFTKIFAWLKPVFITFLAIAVQLIGKSNPILIQAEDVFLDKIRQNFYETEINHRYAKEVNLSYDACTIRDFGNYITAGVTKLNELKIAIAQNDSEYYREHLLQNLDFLQPEEYQRSIEQVQLDGFGARYDEINESDLPDQRTLIGYTQEYEGIDLLVLSEYDPESKIFTILRTDIPPVVFEQGANEE